MDHHLRGEGPQQRGVPFEIAPQTATFPDPPAGGPLSSVGRSAEGAPWRRWLSVTQLNERIRDMLEDALPFVQVQGEVSEVRQPTSRHIYFTLIDRQSRIRAVVWRGHRARLALLPRAGEAVQITGRIAAYPPRGEYQLVVEGLKADGAGAERDRLRALFTRLEAEGLFEQARKKALPFLPDVIGVVTSSTGAAVHDIRRGLDRRFPGYGTLVIQHARVQGEEAEREIIAALRCLIDEGRAQVIICGRGGGSADDLAVFNSERLVRAMADSPIPIVSAVGHEVDWSLTDWVADARAATPFAAAEMVMPDKQTLISRLGTLQTRLVQATHVTVHQHRQVVYAQQRRLRHPRRQIELFRLRCDEWSQRLGVAKGRFVQHHRHRWRGVADRLSRWSQGRSHITLSGHRLHHAQGALAHALRRYLAHRNERIRGAHARLLAVSPLAVLQRGYAMVYDQRGQLARDARSLQTGETLRVVLGQGTLHAVITTLEQPS